MEAGVLIVVIINYVMKLRVYHVTTNQLHLMKKVNIGVVEIQNSQEMCSKVLIKNFGLIVIVGIHLILLYLVLIMEVGVLIAVTLHKHYVIKLTVIFVTITHLHLMKKVNIGAIKT
jgi:hypothetical protein